MDSIENNDEEMSGVRDNYEEERSASEDELGIAF